METQIFYWTGTIIWWGICLMAIGGIGTLAVITPLYAFVRSKGGWWRWYTMGKFLDLGWTQEELNHVAAMMGGANDDFLRKAKKAIKCADAMRNDPESKWYKNSIEIVKED